MCHKREGGGHPLYRNSLMYITSCLPPAARTVVPVVSMLCMTRWSSTILFLARWIMSSSTLDWATSLHQQNILHWKSLTTVFKNAEFRSDIGQTGYPVFNAAGYTARYWSDWISGFQSGRISGKTVFPEQGYRYKRMTLILLLQKLVLSNIRPVTRPVAYYNSTTDPMLKTTKKELKS